MGWVVAVGGGGGLAGQQAARTAAASSIAVSKPRAAQRIAIIDFCMAIALLIKTRLRCCIVLVHFPELAEPTDHELCSGFDPRHSPWAFGTGGKRQSTAGKRRAIAPKSL